MRHILLTAALGLALGATGAIAQTATPVPNASGSQRTNPCDYGSTANALGAQQGTGAAPTATGSVAPVPNASGSQTTNPNSYGNTKKS